MKIDQRLNIKNKNCGKPIARLDFFNFALCILLFTFSAGAAEADTAMMHSFSKGQITPKLGARSDVLGYYSGLQELSNMYTNPQGGASKRPGTYYVENNYSFELIEEVPEVPADPGDYSLTYISENGALWGIPIGDKELFKSLDSGGSAVDIGGGVVGLPYTDHPFVVGMVIRITGTTWYDSQYTLLAGTTANELQISAVYFAETFDGTEVIMNYIVILPAGNGRMDSDSDGNMYQGHNWNSVESTHVTKIEPDGTLVYDFLNHSWTSGSDTVMGLKVFGDYLYVSFLRNVEKYGLTTKNLVWTTTLIRDIYNMDLDADGNAYVQSRELAADATGVLKLSVTDGSVLTKYTDSLGVFDVCVDDDLGVVLAGGFQYGFTADGLYNLSIRTLDNSSGATLALGGTYFSSPLYATYRIGSESILVHDGSIYVLSFTPDPTVYKLDTDLKIVDSIAAPANASGIFVDYWDNLVVVNQGESCTDIFWFYDLNLKYLSKIENMYAPMLNAWGFTYLSGNVVFNGEWIPGTPLVPGYKIEYGIDLDADPVRLIDFVVADANSYVIVMGDKKMAPFEGE